MSEKSDWEAVPFEQVRAELFANGKVTEEGLNRAQTKIDAYVAGYRLAELRQRAQLHQTQVAEAMGVSQSRVSAIERGDMDALIYGHDSRVCDGN